jgi:hypothetical protein
MIRVLRRIRSLRLLRVGLIGGTYTPPGPEVCPMKWENDCVKWDGDVLSWS